MKEIIKTDKAPAAIGTYSQAVRCDKTVYVSGQVPLDPKTMTLVSENIIEQATQVFENLKAVAQAAGGELKDFVKLNVYLIDLNDFSALNEVMAQYFVEPFPARAAVEVSRLPKDAKIEIEGTLFLN